MRIFFAGSPEIAVPSLERISKEHEIVGVLTNPDKYSGRGRKKASTPVKQKACELNLEVFQPEKPDLNFRKRVYKLKPDILVVAAYGKIFKKEFLDIFPKGGINLHPSLLPYYRGCSPIISSILNGEKKTGITIQKLALKMDAGDILAQKEYILKETETAGELAEIFSVTGSKMILSVLGDIEANNINPVPQDENIATYCFTVKKEDGLINWECSAMQIKRMIHAYNPWPGAYTFFKNRKLNILKGVVYEGKPGFKNKKAGTVLGIDKDIGILIQTGSNILAAQKLQLQSKKVLEWKGFLNGAHNFLGSTLGDGK